MKMSLAVVVLLAAVACSSAVRVCPAIYFPVCGTDGRTYASKCVLEGVAEDQGRPDLTVAYTGKCRNLEIAYASMPVAGSEDEYGCKQSMASGVCTLEYDPICTSEGVTEGNHCSFCYRYYQAKKDNVHVSILHHGECTADDFCPKYSKNGICTLEYSPVCGPDGQTYPNFCGYCAALYEKQKSGEKVMYFPPKHGQCETKVEDEHQRIVCLPRYFQGICTREYMPICGSDGRTHDNTCVFCYDKHQMEQNGEVLTVAHFGECETKVEDEPQKIVCLPRYNKGMCTREYMPICGSDGKTHGNTCVFCFDKHQMEQNGETLTVAHFGECETRVEDEPEKIECLPRYYQGICTREYMPICGSDGKTHDNKCVFCFDKHQMEQNGESLTVSHYGECEKKDEVSCPPSYKLGICTDEYAPVCGSDGETYANKCAFCISRDQKENEGSSLKLDHYGQC